MTPAPLGIPALRGLVCHLAADPAHWRHLVRHDPDQRVFERLIDEPEMEAWLICWMPGHDTGFHDHGQSSGAVTVLSGSVREERFDLSETTSRVFAPGDTFDFIPSVIHRVTHTGDQAAVTLHAYSPRLSRVGAYRVERGGALTRYPLRYGEELRPVSVA